MVEMMLVATVMVVLLTVLAKPVVSPMFEKSRVEKRIEFQREATKTTNVTILEKDIGTKISRRPNGVSTGSNQNIIMFELSGEEYYISVSSDFFNGLKQKGTMKLYLQDREGKMLGETPDGKTEFLNRL